jgi:hypothetical protein
MTAAAPITTNSIKFNPLTIFDGLYKEFRKFLCKVELFLNGYKITVEHDDNLRLLEHAGKEVSPGNSVEIKPRELLRIQGVLYRDQHESDL